MSSPGSTELKAGTQWLHMWGRHFFYSFESPNSSAQSGMVGWPRCDFHPSARKPWAILKKRGYHNCYSMLFQQLEKWRWCRKMKHGWEFMMMVDDWRLYYVILCYNIPSIWIGTSKHLESGRRRCRQWRLKDLNLQRYAWIMWDFAQTQPAWQVSPSHDMTHRLGLILSSAAILRLSGVAGTVFVRETFQRHSQFSASLRRLIMRNCPWDPWARMTVWLRSALQRPHLPTTFSLFHPFSKRHRHAEGHRLPSALAQHRRAGPVQGASPCNPGDLAGLCRCRVAKHSDEAAEFLPKKRLVLQGPVPDTEWNGTGGLV